MKVKMYEINLFWIKISQTVEGKFGLFIILMIIYSHFNLIDLLKFLYILYIYSIHICRPLLYNYDVLHT